MTAITDSETQSDLKQDYDKLREDMRELKADLRVLLGDTVAIGRQRAEQGQEKLSQELQDARQVGRHAFAMLKEEIEGHPVGTLGAAFLAGIVAGFFLPKRG
jgi:ElaB/YqjD/DUF883 family membrane-anchored ribosome-binding protein